jgi:hypothetical protein
VLRQVALDQVPGLLGGEPEEHVHAVDVPGVEPNRVRDFRINVLGSVL